MEIFIPDLSLGFEYYSEYHYHVVPLYLMNLKCSYLHSHGDPKIVQQRDIIKRAKCKEFGITLITIPYWWNDSIEGIAHAIHLTRPDIPLSPSLLIGEPISLDLPKKGVERRKNVYSQ